MQTYLQSPIVRGALLGVSAAAAVDLRELKKSINDGTVLAWLQHFNWQAALPRYLIGAATGAAGAAGFGALL